MAVGAIREKLFFNCDFGKIKKINKKVQNHFLNKLLFCYEIEV